MSTRNRLLVTAMVVAIGTIIMTLGDMVALSIAAWQTNLIASFAIALFIAGIWWGSGPTYYDEDVDEDGDEGGDHVDPAEFDDSEPNEAEPFVPVTLPAQAQAMPAAPVARQAATPAGSPWAGAN